MQNQVKRNGLADLHGNRAAREVVETWRIHFHAPLHAAALDPLRTSSTVLREGLAALLTSSDCDHFEVETYTWDVLPPSARPTDDAGLAEGIAAELAFARDQFAALGVS